MRNVFACLVHEDAACVVDLVHNLRTLDPDSTLLLYNGGRRADLLTGFPFDRYGVVLHPSPREMQWGRLHGFAIDAIRYALEHLEFDALTIVDSDQLGVRAGYSHFLGSFWRPRSRVGMFVNSAPQGGTGLAGPARAMLDEFELWRPFLQEFDGDAESIRWSFWPSTVFTASCAQELVDAIGTSRTLEDILARSSLWATEEVIFPTLANLLGYELAENPCNDAYCQWAAVYEPADLAQIRSVPDAFWVHPVQRRYDDPLRVAIRTLTHAGVYRELSGSEPLHAETMNAPAIAASLEAMRPIPGWFDEREAAVLLDCVAAAMVQRQLPPTILEIGSYFGRSTIALGTLLSKLRPEGQLFAIDPHRGHVGSIDTAIVETGDTWDAFRRNVAGANLERWITAYRTTVAAVQWRQLVTAVLVDGLHDYPSVAADGLSVEEALVSGGILALHDYSPDYPGVVTFVQELLSSGRFSVLAHEGSLVVLRKDRDAHAPAGVSPRCAPELAAAPFVRRAAVRASCIMPTCDRPDWARRAIDRFKRQDAQDIELVVVDSGSDDIAKLAHGPRTRYIRIKDEVSLGELRNIACDAATGQTIIHWDDDDWSSRWRVSYQLKELAAASWAEVSGLDSVIFANRSHTRAWLYSYRCSRQPWLAGGTLCYHRSFWHGHPFQDVSEGEDTRFVWTTDPAALHACDVNTFYVAHVHRRNTSVKLVSGTYWSDYPADKVRSLLWNG
jgi:hypothetical protein